MARNFPTKPPYQCEPKRCENTEDWNQNLSGLVNKLCTGKYKARE